jgi:hypothetical protein
MLLALEEAVVAHDLEVMTHGWLAESKRIGELGNGSATARCCNDETQQLDPGRIRHCPQGASDALCVAPRHHTVMHPVILIANPSTFINTTSIGP